MQCAFSTMFTATLRIHLSALNFVFSRNFHHLAPTYFRRPAVWQKFVMSDVLCAFFAVKTVAILTGSYPKPGLLSYRYLLLAFQYSGSNDEDVLLHV